jgi:hypothetical protein
MDGRWPARRAHVLKLTHRPEPTHIMMRPPPQKKGFQDSTDKCQHGASAANGVALESARCQVWAYPNMAQLGGQLLAVLLHLRQPEREKLHGDREEEGRQDQNTATWHGTRAGKLPEWCLLGHPTRADSPPV